MVNSEIHQGARENQVATFTILPDNSAYYSSWDNIEQPCIGDEGGLKVGYNNAICDAIIQF